MAKNANLKTLLLIAAEITLLLLLVKYVELTPKTAFWIIVGQGVIFGLLNGGNDLANGIAAAVATRALGIIAAVSLGAFFNFLGTVSGEAVAQTIAKGIVPPRLLDPSIVVAGGGGAIIISSLATYRGWPISITHSLVGGILGAGIAAGLIAGGSATDKIAWNPMIQWVLIALFTALFVGLLGGFVWGRKKKEEVEHILLGAIVATGLTATAFLPFAFEIKLAKIILGVALAPFWSILLGMVFRFIINKCIDFLPDRMSESRLNKWLRHFQIFSSMGLSFSHGLNDGQNIVAFFIFASIIGAAQGAETSISLWMKLAAAGAMAAGTMFLGLPVLRTATEKITKMDPASGLASQVGGSTVIVLHSLKSALENIPILKYFGANPISTTHSSIGAIMGTAIGKKMTLLNIEAAAHILASWVLTIPFAAFAGAVLLYVFHILGI